MHGNSGRMSICLWREYPLSGSFLLCFSGEVPDARSEPEWCAGQGGRWGLRHHESCHEQADLQAAARTPRPRRNTGPGWRRHCGGTTCLQFIDIDATNLGIHGWHQKSLEFMVDTKNLSQILHFSADLGILESWLLGPLFGQNPWNRTRKWSHCFLSLNQVKTHQLWDINRSELMQSFLLLLQDNKKNAIFGGLVTQVDKAANIRKESFIPGTLSPVQQPRSASAELENKWVCRTNEIQLFGTDSSGFFCLPGESWRPQLLHWLPPVQVVQPRRRQVGLPHHHHHSRLSLSRPDRGHLHTGDPGMSQGAQSQSQEERGQQAAH